MPPHDASNRDSDARSRLRHYVEKTKSIDDGERPGLASCPRVSTAAVIPAHDEADDDGPITTRWAVG
jgi:hypothetical protein